LVPDISRSSVLPDVISLGCIEGRDSALTVWDRIDVLENDEAIFNTS